MRRTGALVRMSSKRKPKFRRRHNGRGNPGGLVPEMRLFNPMLNLQSPVTFLPTGRFVQRSHMAGPTTHLFLLLVLSFSVFSDPEPSSFSFASSFLEHAGAPRCYGRRTPYSGGALPGRSGGGALPRRSSGDPLLGELRNGGVPWQRTGLPYPGGGAQLPSRRLAG